MFIVPDKLLDDLSCDICNKVLSVGPVKVYPNRKVKCGRCSKNDKGGAISQYNLIMQHAIFMCVNRFDGCKVLLSSNQVENHENTCHSKTNVCPVCPKTTEIPTFLLVSHFAKFHKNCRLLMPSFDMDVTFPNTNTYLWKVNDNLSFILFFNDLSCDICNKLLSVGPVKIYPNRKMKCGRCSKNDKGGVISQYDLMMKHAIFKCVNRFEGCKVLLSSDQVENHESTCHSKASVCPVCPETTKIPTFLLVSHFATFHKDSLLLTPSFDMDVTSPNTNTYLYKVKDNLFFIESACISTHKIRFNAFFIGDAANTPTLKCSFNIQYRGESRKVDAIRKSGDSYDFNSASKVYMVHVDFKKCLEKVHFSKMLVNDEYLKNPLKIIFPRKIICSCLYRTVNSKFIVKDCYFIDPHCPNCFMPCAGSQSYLQMGSTIQPVCKICENYLDLCPNLNLIDSDYKYLNHTFFSCIWCSFGCSIMVGGEYILMHEIQCCHQPPQKCPVQFCKARLKLFNFEEHFRNTHPVKAIALNPSFNIDFPEDISGIHFKEWYIWVQLAFVVLEVSQQNRKWRLHVRALDHNRHEPRFLMLQNGKEPLIGHSCEFEGSCSSHILCYFGDINPINTYLSY